jgi:hypothetical protein
MTFSTGQVVRVKPGQKDEETGISLAGWSGWIKAIYPEYGTVEIDWDSLTLLNMPDAYIRHSLDEGYDYLSYTLEEGGVEVTEPRDTPEQVEDMREELEARYHDYEMYGGPAYPFTAVEREKFTREILLPQSFSGWLDYLEKHLAFPFPAKVAEGRQTGTLLDILALEDYDDKYGVIAVVKWKDGGAGNFQLCDLEALDKRSANYSHLRDYVVWFANR